MRLHLAPIHSLVPNQQQFFNVPRPEGILLLKASYRLNMTLILIHKSTRSKFKLSRMKIEP